MVSQPQRLLIVKLTDIKKIVVVCSKVATLTKKKKKACLF